MNAQMTKKSFITRIAVAVLLAALVFGATYYFTSSVFGGSRIASAEEETRYCESDYASALTYVTTTQTISYATKSTTGYAISNSFPKYYIADTSVIDGCAAVAGSILMGYYDRYFSELIPGTATGSGRGILGYSYYQQSQISSYIASMQDTFYTLMNIGQYGAGATREEYLSGMESYVESKGYGMSYESVMSGSSINLTALDAALHAGEPVSIYMTGFGLATNINDNGSSAVYTINVYSSSTHIMIVYGYQKVDYYNAAGQLVDTRINLQVASGISNVDGYVTLGIGSLDHADAVDVF